MRTRKTEVRVIIQRARRARDYELAVCSFDTGLPSVTLPTNAYRLEACATEEHLAGWSFGLLTRRPEQLRLTGAAQAYPSSSNWCSSQECPEFPVISRNRTRIARYFPFETRIFPVNPG